MKNIVVIGAGTMGNGIAHTFAQTGFTVNLVDVSAEALEKVARIYPNQPSSPSDSPAGIFVGCILPTPNVTGSEEFLR